MEALSYKLLAFSLFSFFFFSFFLSSDFFYSVVPDPYLCTTTTVAVSPPLIMRPGLFGHSTGLCLFLSQSLSISFFLASSVLFFPSRRCFVDPCALSSALMDFCVQTIYVGPCHLLLHILIAASFYRR
ncbi:uncharacterized protein LOC112093765 [Morus notabilis]|uniref:uncharacterized protein LOC112093765 n=1 Tax=Morus notabilis TaxID=981085 RepID=UPI000CED6451|nr:uncharacterized protein LOC112093765 [Morus notabilis]